jgi:hypothetical protein
MKLENIRNPQDAIFWTQTKIIELRKNDFLLPPTKVEKYLYFIVSGILGSLVKLNGE